MKKAYLLLFFTIFALSCSVSVRKYGTIDRTQKSITIPAGGDKFVLALKDYFYQNGWKVENFQGAEVTEKRSGRDLKYDTFNTRYVLYGEYTLDTDDMAGPLLHNATISIVDVKSRSEVLIFESGEKMRVKGFVSDMAEHIDQAMQ